MNQWCTLATRDQTETIYIAAIHLPSLLCLPEATSQPPVLPKGTALRTGEVNMGARALIDIIPSENLASRYDSISEYTVILSRHPHRFAFDIRIDVVPGSIYGKIVWSGTKLPLPTNRQLEERVSSQISTSTSDPSDSFRLTSTQRSFEVMTIGLRPRYCIQILRMTNLCTSDHTRKLSWKAPLRRSTGTSAGGNRLSGRP